MADIIDGKAFAAKIRAEVKEDSDKLISQKKNRSLSSCSASRRKSS